MPGFLIPMAAAIAGGVTTHLLNRGDKGYDPKKANYSDYFTQKYGYVPQAQTTTYTQADDMAGQIAAAEKGQYGMQGALGGVNWTGSTANGNRRLNVKLGALDKEKYAAARKMIPDLFGSQFGQDAENAHQQAVMNMFENRMTPQFEKQTKDTATMLARKGIPVGSAAHDRAMRNLEQGQNDAKLNAYNQSILTGQQAHMNAVNTGLGLFGAASNINNPISSYIPGLGGNFTSAYANMQGNKLNYDQMAQQRELGQMQNKLGYDQMTHQGEMGILNNHTQMEQAKIQAEAAREAARRKSNSGIGGLISTIGSVLPF